MNYKYYLKLIQTSRTLGNDNCALCGSHLASETTNEHIPPKTLIADKTDVQFLTVPSCYDCNNGSSESDILFRNGLALTLFNQEQKTTEATKLIKKWKIYLKKRNLSEIYRKSITRANVGRVNLSHKVAIPIFDKHRAFPSEHQNPVLIKMVSGLYWLNHKGQHMLSPSNIGSELFVFKISPNPSNFIRSQSEKHFVGMALKNNQLIIRHSQSLDKKNELKFGNPMTFWFHFYSHVNEDKKISFDIGTHYFIVFYPKQMKEYLKIKGLEDDLLSASSGRGTAYKINNNYQWEQAISG